METALGAQREHLIVLVAKDLHLKMPWFHGKISRDEADKRIANDGHQDGKFLYVYSNTVYSFEFAQSYVSPYKDLKLICPVLNLPSL